jgi:hypothetical protein
MPSTYLFEPVYSDPNKHATHKHDLTPHIDTKTSYQSFAGYEYISPTNYKPFSMDPLPYTPSYKY